MEVLFESRIGKRFSPAQAQRPTASPSWRVGSNHFRHPQTDPDRISGLRTAAWRFCDERTIQAVVRRGKLYQRAALDAMLAKAEPLASYQDANASAK
jgi:hypothetical protein